MSATLGWVSERSTGERALRAVIPALLGLQLPQMAGQHPGIAAILNGTDDLPEFTKCLVRSPAAPKITMAQGPVGAS